MKTYKRIGSRGRIVFVGELARVAWNLGQFFATSPSNGDGHTLSGYGDTIEEAVDAACGV